ncbi:MAG: permease prefix domain 1-containing protein, partial [Bryobacteraceae bacterium]
MMRFFRIFTMRLRSLLEKQHLDAELDDELRFHLENQIARNVESGMSPKEARESALRQFGGLTQRK